VSSRFNVRIPTATSRCGGCVSAPRPHRRAPNRYLTALTTAENGVVPGHGPVLGRVFPNAN